MDNHAYVLSIAGFDPSSGAGITSDVKTFAAHGLYGLSVCTAVTVQNDVDFKSSQWISEKVIIEQIDTLFDRFEISVVKIGIVESWSILLRILQRLKELNADILIVLDPILKASAGFVFHDGQKEDIVLRVLSLCSIVTPNYEEVQQLFSNKDLEDTISLITEHCHLYLKGGHRKDKLGVDELYKTTGEKLTIIPEAKAVFQKHGSGCVLSSSIASNLGLGKELNLAVKNAKYYTEQYLNSSKTLLGKHNYITNDN